VWDMRSKVQVHCLTGHDDTVCSILSQGTDPQVTPCPPPLYPTSELSYPWLYFGGFDSSSWHLLRHLKSLLAVTLGVWLSRTDCACRS
jgi:hypothetical protein